MEIVEAKTIQNSVQKRDKSTNTDRKNNKNAEIIMFDENANENHVNLNPSGAEAKPVDTITSETESKSRVYHNNSNNHGKNNSRGRQLKPNNGNKARDRSHDRSRSGSVSDHDDAESANSDASPLLFIGGSPAKMFSKKSTKSDMIPAINPNVNVYQQKKNLAQGMMDLALVSANANQLRYVLVSFSRHPYFLCSLVLISTSLLCQVVVGIGLIWKSQYDIRNHDEFHKADRVNNLVTIGVFLITLVNVLISSFGVADPEVTVH